jgi:Na+/citrate or Na+/malate symporter
MSQTTISTSEEKKEGLQICGMPALWFWAIMGLVVIAAEMNTIENKIMGGYTISLVFGIAFNWVGQRTPLLKNYGGGSILAVLVPAICIYLGILPEYLQKVSSNFFTGYDWVSFLVPSLLVGSILSMDRNIMRYPCIVWAGFLSV